jgi:hypothetical protein
VDFRGHPFYAQGIGEKASPVEQARRRFSERIEEGDIYRDTPPGALCPQQPSGCAWGCITLSNSQNFREPIRRALKGADGYGLPSEPPPATRQAEFQD